MYEYIIERNFIGYILLEGSSVRDPSRYGAIYNYGVHGSRDCKYKFQEVWPRMIKEIRSKGTKESLAEGVVVKDVNINKGVKMKV